MKRYLYILALNFGPEKPIGFVHAFVDAPDEDKAYGFGFKVLEATTKREQRMNDYVVELT